MKQADRTEVNLEPKYSNEDGAPIHQGVWFFASMRMYAIKFKVSTIGGLDLLDIYTHISTYIYIHTYTCIISNVSN